MHRRNYTEDPNLCDRVFELLDTCFPTLRAMRRDSAFLQSRWEDLSTPFIAQEDGRILSHVGVLELPLVCHGVERLVAGLHAVCTLESERRRGLYRSVMEEVLTWCDERYSVVEISTANPEYYTPFGFRHVPEQRYRVRVDAPGGRAGFRRLDLSTARELSLLDGLLERRAPVSQSLSVMRESRVFKCAVAGTSQLHYHEGLDTLLVMERQEGCLELLDVVSPTLPPLRDLLREISEPIREVRFHFNPEHFDVDASPEPIGDDWWLVRGDFPFGKRELPRGMVPPTARH